MTCPCSGGKRRNIQKTAKLSKKKKRGGSMIGDAVLAGTALGLYSYFKKKGGSRRMPTRKTRKALV